jgi:hypothetical protein
LGYRKPKSYGKGFGGYPRSGYFRPSWDPMPPYRQPSAPETEYERKVKNRTFRSEVSGPSGNSLDAVHYKPNFIKSFAESKLSQKEVDELSEKILERAMDDFKKLTSATEIPQEKYEVMQDTANEIADRFVEVRNNPDDNTTVVDFTKEFLENRSMSNFEIREKAEEIRVQLEEMKSEALEIRDSLPEFERFAEDMKRTNKFLNAEAIPNETTLEPEANDVFSTRKRRNEIGYDSEIGY